MLKLHYLQHVEFEGLASIESWAQAHQHQISCSQLYLNNKPPEQSDFDCLIVMGGPMNIYETEKYPWLEREKIFIKQSINANKSVLGICLGAQLIADVLGANITKAAHKEIGWFPVHKSDEIRDTFLDDVFPESMEAYHWHADTFSLPEGALHIISSEACKNQGFLYKDRVIGLQCHLESTLESATTLVNNCGDELTPGKFVQSGDEMLSNKNRFNSINKIIHRLMDALQSQSIHN